MKKTKRIVFFTIIFMIIFLPFSGIMAADTVDTNDYNPDSISTNSESVILLDAKTGKVLYSKNAFARMYPASTTKLMTAILTLENCELDEVATVSHNAVYSIPVGYSHASLVEGEELTIEQLLNALLIPSANDAAIVLAEYISGSVEEFSELMNQKATELGCLDTNFVNPNGIHDENHYSTAYDLSLIGMYAMQFEDIMRIAQVTQYTLPTTNAYDKEDRIFNTTNGLIDSNNSYYYEYTTGLKTGYTDKSGSCIVATAQKNDVELLEVVLGAESNSKRYEDCINLFNYGFNNFSYRTIINSGEIVESLVIENATPETENLNILTKDEISILVKNNTDINRIEKNIELNDNLIAPIWQDSVVGTLSFTLDGETYSTELIADSTVIENSYKTYFIRALIIFAIFILFILIIGRINRPKKRKRKASGKSKSKNKKTSRKKGGQYKFTQISDYI